MFGHRLQTWLALLLIAALLGGLGTLVLPGFGAAHAEGSTSEPAPEAAASEAQPAPADASDVTPAPAERTGDLGPIVTKEEGLTADGPIAGGTATAEAGDEPGIDPAT